MNSAAQLKQSEYHETPYHDSAWEIVGDSQPVEDFVPLEVFTVPGTLMTVDPVFADYGGRQTESTARRWHLPEGVAAESFTGNPAAPGDAPEPEGLRITEEELERIKAEAFEAGRSAALAEATEQSTQKLQELHGRVEGIRNDLQGQLVAQVDQIERTALDLALSLSQRILLYAVEINPEYLLPVVREALTHVGAAGIHRIRVSPEDMEFLQLIGFSRQLKESDGSWQFEADPTVRAGCVIDTTAGAIDFQLDRAWERVRDQVIKVTRANT